MMVPDVMSLMLKYLIVCLIAAKVLARAYVVDGYLRRGDGGLGILLGCSDMAGSDRLVPDEATRRVHAGQTSRLRRA